MSKTPHVAMLFTDENGVGWLKFPNSLPTKEPDYLKKVIPIRIDES